MSPVVEHSVDVVADGADVRHVLECITTHRGRCLASDLEAGEVCADSVVHKTS